MIVFGVGFTGEMVDVGMNLFAGWFALFYDYLSLHFLYQLCLEYSIIRHSSGLYNYQIEPIKTGDV